MADPNYPVSEQYKVLEGYDLYRGSNLIIALVAVESKFGKDLRLYRWQMRKGAWKVDLARMSVKRWDWEKIAAKAREMKEKHGIKDQGTSESPQAEES